MSRPALSGLPGAPPLALIASVARNGVIGQANGLAWHEPEDQRWFKQQTLGCPVVMGRKTWASLPVRFRPLPGRANIVVTRQADWQDAGAQVAHDLATALAMAGQAAAATEARRIFVIGGGQLFGEALPWVDELLLTEIDADLPGDTCFPAWDRQDFRESERLARPAPGPGRPAFAFVTYQRQR